MVFHPADLFHSIVLEMESAARGELSYEAVIRHLSKASAEKGLDGWLAATLADLEKLQVQTQGVA